MNEHPEGHDERALRDQLEDALLRYIMYQRALAELDEAEKLLAEEPPGLSQAELEAAFQRGYPRFMRALARRSQRARGPHTRPPLRHLANALAYILLSCYLLGTVALAVSPTARVYLKQFLVSVQEEYTELSFDSSPDRYVDVPGNWPGDYFPTYIPEGFELVSVIGSKYACELGYASGSRMLFFSEYDSHVETSIDTEGAQIETIQIGNETALVSYKKGVTMVAWPDNNRYFLIEFDGPQEEAIRIAEHVSKFK